MVRSLSVSVTFMVSGLIVGSISETHIRPSLMLIDVTSTMLIPQTCTAKASGLRRFPWQL